MKANKVTKFMLISMLLVAVLSSCATPTAAPAAPAAAEPAAVEATKAPAAAEPAAAAPAAADDIKIGILQKSRSDQYQILLNAAQESALKELKDAGKIADYQMVDADTDVQKQLNEADDLIAMKVDVLVMSPVDAKGTAPIVEKAKEAGIPIVIVNSKTSNVDEATAFVGSNDVEAGEIMGNFIIEKLGGKGNAKGNFLQLEGDIGNSAQIDRDQGLKNTVYKEPGIKVLESLTGKWLREEGMRITEDWLQKYPDISAIAAENDNMGMGALNAVINAGRKDKITIISVDAIEDAKISVKNGELDATVLQDANGQGKGSIDVAYKIVKGEKYDKVTNIPFVLITKDNVDKYLKSSEPAAAAPAAPKKDIKIGILQKSRSDQYQILLNAAQESALKELKDAGKIADYQMVDADTDVQKQLNEADDLIAMKVDVLVMSPVDAKGTAPIVEKAKEAGIPIVIVNSKTSNVDEATAFVGSNDVEAGEIMGNFIIEKLGGKGNAKGNFLQLEGDIGNSAQIDRDQGLKNTVYKEPGIKVLESLTGKWLREEGMRITEDWLQKYPDISAIAAENDNMGMGALNAVINAGRKDKITIISVDAIEDAKISVKNGELDATVLQDANGQGKGSIDVAFKIVAGEKYDKVTNIPFVLITKDNVEQYLSK